MGYGDQGAGTHTFLGFWRQSAFTIFFLARSDELVTNASGVVHPAHCHAKMMLPSFLATVSESVFNGVVPTVLNSDSAALIAARHKLESSLYIHGARFETQNWVAVAEPLLLW